MRDGGFLYSSRILCLFHPLFPLFHLIIRLFYSMDPRAPIFLIMRDLGACPATRVPHEASFSLILLTILRELYNLLTKVH